MKATFTRSALPVKLAKINMKGISKQQQLEVLKAFLSNPAVIGTILYLSIGFINSKSSGSSFTIPYLNITVPVGNLSYDALQAALLAYIATGGNLAGTLQGGANLLEKLPGILASFGGEAAAVA